MIFPKNAIKYHCQSSGKKSNSIYELLNDASEIDQIGAVEQIIFSFPLRGRTIYKGIYQSYVPTTSSNLCPLSNVWTPCIGQLLGDGTVSVDEFYETLKSLQSDLSANVNNNRHVLLPLSGGLDSRFIAGCLVNKENVDSFTFHSGPSTEVLVAKKIAGLYGINHRRVSLGSSIYTKAELFHKHLGMLQHYHAALITIAHSFYTEYPKQSSLMPHGFMGDPIFGSKASYRIKLSMDETCERYLNTALKRYPFFASSISKSLKNEILEDLTGDYIYYGAKDSNSNFEEILFLTRRQQMIYKMVDLIDDIIPALTPYASSHALINSALRLPQGCRISRKAFSSYLEKHSLISPKVNSENPWGIHESFATTIRRIINYSQYLLEYFNPEIKLSPFQHEQLRASVYANFEYVEENVNILEGMLNFKTGYEKSQSRRFNAIDFAYTCSSIGHAFRVIKSKRI